jgi:hypothetical protein
MFRKSAKTTAALTFLTLITVPLTFFRLGAGGALKEEGFVGAVFVVAAFWGHRWMRSVLRIDSPPLDFDARILTGLAFALVFLAVSRNLQIGSI